MNYAPKRVIFIVIMLSFLLLSIFLPSASAEVEYRLGIGDGLQVSVWGHQELATTVEVRPDGYVTFPLVGDRFAVGKTAMELADEIEQALDEYVVNPRVTVIVTRFRTIKVQVMGEAQKVGYYELRANSRLMDAVGLAGGPNQMADLTNVTITRYSPLRQDAELLTVNAEKYIKSGSLSHNPVLENGDVIYLPAAGKALVLGEIRNPAGYNVGSQMDLLDLVAMAGGPLDSADLENVIVTRGSGSAEEFIVNLKGLMSGLGKGSVSVFPNDVVFIPTQRQVIILGDVRQPGTYPLKKDSRLLDVIGAAGGLLPTADGTRISITRNYGEEQQVLTIDAKEALSGRSGGENPPLSGGDIVFVPSGTNHILVLGQVRNPGSYNLEEETRVLDAIGMAGGLTDRAAQERVTLTRSEDNGLKVQEINIDRMQRLGEGQDMVVRPGDVLFVPEGSPQALVLGLVRNPGSYRVHSEMRLLDVLAQAGGALERAGQNILLTRNGKTDEIDLGVLSRLGIGNQLVQPGDVIYVTEGRHQVLVLGAVRNPGYYQLNYGDRVLDGIGLAGGLREDAALDQVTLTRHGENQSDVFEIDMNRLLTNRFIEGNLPLQGGDIIIVPEMNRRVLVLGEVERPGYYELDGESRVLDVIGLAGGFTNSGDPNGVRFTRYNPDGQSHTAILAMDQVMQGAGGENPQVQGGDVVFVPERRGQALVFGEVRSPGYYQVKSNTRLLDVIAQAGGMTDAADGEKVTFTFEIDGETHTELIDVRKVMDTGEGNVPLRGGEMLLIPKAKRDVLVLGEVARPGNYVVEAGDRILDVLARAGGLLDSADGSRATLTNADGEVVSVDLEDVSRRSGVKGNLGVSGGSVLFVPKARREVLVLGEVVRPGMYQVQPDERILDVLARAGGLNEQADGRSVAFTDNNGQTTTINLDMVLTSSNHEDNHRVEGGNVIYVPRADREVLVLGRVAKPGMYSIRQEERILDVLARAGGPLDDADLTASTLTRRVSGQEQVQEVPLDEMLRDGNHPSNTAVLGGDVLFVPQANKRVLVLGQVQRPGAYLVDAHTRLLDIIAMAGGPTERADLANGTLTRITDGEETVLAINIDSVIKDKENNLPLLGGDILYLPEAREVIVMGEVTRPGAYVLPSGGRVLDILALAGGMRNNYGEQDILLTRQGPEGEQVWHMTYQSLMSEQATSNLLIAGGDVLYVPESQRQVLVLGQVARPGVYTVSGGARVLDAIAMAGGPTDRAALETIGIYRDGNVSAPSTLTMGKDKLLFQGNIEENPEIKGGDVIYIPETKKPNWTSIFGFIGGLRTFQQLIQGIVN